MVKISLERVRISGASKSDAEYVLIINAPQYSSLVLDQFERFSLEPGKVAVRTSAKLETDRDFEKVTPPALVVLGVDDSSARVLQMIKLHWPQAQVLLVASSQQIADVYPLMAAGAHDVILNGADAQEKCLVRLGAFRAKVSNQMRSLGRLTVNLMQRTVTNGSESISLTPIEIKIVATLAESVGGVVPRETMKQLCWGDMEITDNALNRKIYEVRRTLRKLSEDVNIRTIYGLGFELSVRGDQAAV
jgi:DNA-binding response OmpR family regulator